MADAVQDAAGVAVGDGPRLSSQRLLLTLLADYGFANAGEFPSGAIVDSLGEFGISQAGARVALSRVARSGRLVQSRRGRNTFYSVNEEGLQEREARMRRYIGFGAEPVEWDGLWTVVVFSVPEEDRGLRPRLRRELERLRLSPLTDAVWVQAYDCGEEIARIGAALGVGLAVLRAEFQHPQFALLQPVSAFDLDRVRGQYEDYIAAFEPWLGRMRRGEIDPGHALVLRANVLAEWVQIASTDPDLPAALLPEDWPQAAARAVFMELWAGLGDIALARLRQIVGRHDKDAAARLSLRQT